MSQGEPGISSEELDEIVAKMTPGEWRIDPYSDGCTTAIESVTGQHVLIIQHWASEAGEINEEYDAQYERAGNNAAGIVALRNSATKLLAAARRCGELEAENGRLKTRLLSAAGDDLCRLSQEEIKAMSLGAVKIPPKEEFLASCERFHAQVAKESGVMSDCLTLAQLVAENAAIESQLIAAASEFGQLCITAHEQRVIIATQESELAAMRKDAERYRCFRRAGFREGGVTMRLDQLDAAVDQVIALAAKPTEER